MPAEKTSDQRRQRAKKTLRRVKIVMAVIFIGLLALSAGVIAIVVRGNGALPELNRTRFDAAQSQWEKTAPPSYHIEITVTGRQAAIYRVEVRDGEVASARHNGRPLKQQRTQGTWSVPGMFGTISSDVENLEKVTTGTADASTPRLRLRAKFHPRYGYPERYQRIQQDTGTEVTWEVTRFEVISN